MTLASLVTPPVLFFEILAACLGADWPGANFGHSWIIGCSAKILELMSKRVKKNNFIRLRLAVVSRLRILIF